MNTRQVQVPRNDAVQSDSASSIFNIQESAMIFFEEGRRLVEGSESYSGIMHFLNRQGMHPEADLRGNDER